MKKVLKKKLVKHLEKQRYPYLWEVTLLSMLESNSDQEYLRWSEKFTNEPMAAICTSECLMFLKLDTAIISFIEAINKKDDEVCIVIAHANYNPADLLAFYVLDCEKGEEKKCFQAVCERWSHCSELYFWSMKTSRAIEELEHYHPKPKKFFFNFFN